MNVKALLSSASLALTACSSMQGTNSEPLDTLQSARAELETLQEKGFIGSVLIACNDRIVLEQDVGVDHNSRNILRYEVASISKWITAIAILTLFENGHIDLNDSIEKYFPEAPPEKADITLFHLLTHQSGLLQNYKAEGQSVSTNAASAILNAPLSFKPGTNFAYSNDNYSLLAIVIERASGVPYKTYLHKVITQPLGQAPIAFWPDSLREGETMPPLLNERTGSPGRIDWGFLGGHGARMSVRELFSILRAIDHGDILGPDAMKLLQSPHVFLPSRTAVGMGWYINTDEQGRHLESTRGQDESGGNAVVYKVGQDGLIIIAATNNGPEESQGPGWSRQVRDAMIDIFAASDHQASFCRSEQS